MQRNCAMPTKLECKTDETLISGGIVISERPGKDRASMVYQHAARRVVPNLKIFSSARTGEHRVWVLLCAYFSQSENQDIPSSIPGKSNLRKPI